MRRIHLLKSTLLCVVSLEATVTRLETHTQTDTWQNNNCTRTTWRVKKSLVLVVTVRLLSRSWLSAAGTGCLCMQRPPQIGGGQSCRGSKVMSLPATCSRVQLKRRRTPPWRTHGRMRNTSAVMGHWLEILNKLQVVHADTFKSSPSDCMCSQLPEKTDWELKLLEWDNPSQWTLKDRFTIFQVCLKTVRCPYEH